jgi:hypothetical protein
MKKNNSQGRPEKLTAEELELLNPAWLAVAEN